MPKNSSNERSKGLQKCRHCNFVSKESEDLKHHFLLHHTGQSHQCTICQVCFSNEQLLALHLKSELHRKNKLLFGDGALELTTELDSDDEEEPAVSTVTVTESSSSQTASDPLSVSDDKSTFRCSSCSYQGTSRANLKRHLKIHAGERNYMCKYCPYKALNSVQLKRHNRIHTGAKPFKCPYCPYTSNTIENIRKHILKTKRHAGCFVYVCSFCTRGFNLAKEYRDHLVGEHPAQTGGHANPISSSSLESISLYSGLYTNQFDPKEPIEGQRVFSSRRETKQ